MLHFSFESAQHMGRAECEALHAARVCLKGCLQAVSGFEQACAGQQVICGYAIDHVDCPAFIQRVAY